MGIVAGFLVQNTLKHLLKFGEVTHYLGYSALNDFFPTMSMKPNPNCEDNFCRKRQEDFAARPKLEIDLTIVKEEETQPLHEDNEWGISLVDESNINAVTTNLGEGLRYAYDAPDSSLPASTYGDVLQKDTNLEELMAQMKSI